MKTAEIIFVSQKHLYIKTGFDERRMMSTQKGKKK